LASGKRNGSSAIDVAGTKQRRPRKPAARIGRKRMAVLLANTEARERKRP